MKKYIDLHCHPFKEYFDSPDVIIRESINSGIGRMFIVGTSLIDSEEVINTCSKHKEAFPIIGIHPNNSFNKNDLLKLEKLLDNSVVGIGEVGFDFHYDNSPSKKDQEYFFRFQIELSIKLKLPIIVHTRDATQETFDVLKEYKEKNPELKIIIHSYSSGPKWVEKFLSIDAYLSYSGVITFKSALEARESVLLTPLNRIFYETDTPYLTPTPFRGKINLPHYSIYVADSIAKLKGISVEFLNEQVNKNIDIIFNLEKEKNE